MQKLAEKSLGGKWQKRIDRHGAWAILLLTPLAGVWTIGMIAKVLKYERTKLWTYSGISIGVTGLILAILTNMGV
ncbi:MAG: hypothetical protein ACRC5C_07400, partial [Bacilli bacterium]